MIDVSIVELVVLEFLICVPSIIIDKFRRLFCQAFEFVMSERTICESLICEFVTFDIVRFEL